MNHDLSNATLYILLEQEESISRDINSIDFRMDRLEKDLNKCCDRKEELKSKLSEIRDLIKARMKETIE